MFARTKAVVALLAASTIVLAGCAGETKKQEPDVLTLLRTKAAESLQVSLEKTEKAKSASFTVEGKSEGESVKGKGVVQYADSPRMSIVMEDPEVGTLEMRVISSAFYMSVSPKEQAEMDGKKWLKIDIAGASKLAKDKETADLVEEFGRQMRDFDPAVQVKALTSGGELDVVGEESIDGVKTVHYSGTRPIADYLGGIDQASRAKMEEALAKAGVKDFKADVWVDEKYQPRRIKTVVGKTEDMTVTFSDYGIKVDVAEPPADQTLDFVKMLEELAKLGQELGDLEE